MSEVRLARLVKRYDAAATPAVDDVSLVVASGEVVALLGPSGCGKTTTLKCIAGLEDPDDGTIAIGGQRVADRGFSLPPERRHVGMVFQSYALWPHMTVFDNVAYPLEVRGAKRGDVRDKTLAALESVGLREYAARYPAQLSGGQQQRVALARSVVWDPKVVLLDEPLSNLDARLRAQMRLELRTLIKRLGTTAIYVTHDRFEAMAICDRIVLMNAGRIVQEGTPEQLFRQPVNLFAAEFMGGGNVLSGTVLGIGSPYAHVGWAGQVVRCQLPPGVEVGDPVILVLRAEQLRLVEPRGEPPEPNCWPATVTQRLYMGTHAEYLVELAGCELHVADANLGWRATSQANVAIAAEDVICLRPEGRESGEQG